MAQIQEEEWDRKAAFMKTLRANEEVGSQMIITRIYLFLLNFSRPQSETEEEVLLFDGLSPDSSSTGSHGLPPEILKKDD